MRKTTQFISTLLFAGMLAVLIGCDSSNTGSSAGSQAGDYIDDATITTKVKASLFSDDTLSGYEISVETEDGVVQLSGFVSSQREIDRATRVARNVDNVKSVDNAIRIE